MFKIIIGLLLLITTVGRADIITQTEPLVFHQNMYFESFPYIPNAILDTTYLHLEYTSNNTLSILNNSNNSYPDFHVIFNDSSFLSLEGIFDGYDLNYSSHLDYLWALDANSTSHRDFIVSYVNYGQYLDNIPFLNADHLRAFTFERMLVTIHPLASGVLINHEWPTTMGMVTLTYNYHIIPNPDTMILFLLAGLMLLRRK